MCLYILTLITPSQPQPQTVNPVGLDDELLCMIGNLPTSLI
jgi:hypothetical protein